MKITTERLILRPWEDADAEDLYEYAKDPAVGPSAGWPPHTSIGNSLEIIRSVLSEKETYAVCLKENNRAIGSIGLMIGKQSNLGLRGDEGEIGYWIGREFWGRGLIPEAVNGMLRRGFEELGLKTVWCGYFDGNEKSKRVQEKCGFVYHHTNENVFWQLTDSVFTEHVTRLTSQEYFLSRQGLRIVRISDSPALKEKAAEWFSSKWSVPYEAYLQSMEESFAAVVPEWYLCLDGDEIAAGLGVIENDFHPRKDLTPNVCAVYTEEKYRNRGIAGKMLGFVCSDMVSRGIGTLYLLTDHDSFYERYDWTYLCDVTGDGEDVPSRMYVIGNDR